MEACSCKHLLRHNDIFIVAVREEMMSKQPFPNLKSNLCTLIILQNLGRANAFSILRQLSHTSRAYFSRQHEMLMKNVKVYSCLGN